MSKKRTEKSTEQEEEPFVFDGFEPANTTPVPDVFFDVLMPHLNEAQLKVMLYIIRRTLGFKKGSDAISLTQFRYGITTRSGKKLDSGCGLKNFTTISKALKSLEEMKCIESVKGKTSEGDQATTVYRVRFRGTTLTVVPTTQSVVGVLQQTEDRTTASVAPVLRQTESQETVLQQTDLQDTDKQEREEEATSTSKKTSLLSSDQQIFFHEIYCHAKIGKVIPDIIDETLKKHIVKLMQHTKSVEELDSLYEYVQKRLLETNLKDKTVYPGNLTSAKYLGGWLQEQERQAKELANMDPYVRACMISAGRLPNLTEQRLQASTPGSQYIVDDLEEAAVGHIAKMDLIFGQLPEYWTEEHIKHERPIRQDLIRARLSQWRQEHDLITTGPLAGQPDYHADPWA